MKKFGRKFWNEDRSCQSFSHKWKCKKCNMIFKTCQNLKDHKKNQIHDRNSLQCDVCNEKFTDRLSLKMHQQIHATIKTIPCTKCEEKFTTRYYLYVHQHVHKAEKPYPCHICREQFSYKVDRKAHITTQHVGEKHFYCYKCKNSFQYQKELKHHKKSCKIFNCELCDMKFAEKSVLRKHLRNNHFDGKPHKCEFCDEHFEKKVQLVLHEGIHRKDKPFMCKLCLKCYASRNSLKCHQRTHTDEQLSTCIFCKQKFLTKGQLVKHEKTHIEGKSFKCDLCPKKYATRGHLQEHIRVHFKDQSFQCEFCGKVFPYNQSLKVHVRTHTGEKPYSCSLCNVKFSESRQYKKHRTHCAGQTKLFNYLETNSSSNILKNKALEDPIAVPTEVENDVNICQLVSEKPKLLFNIYSTEESLMDEERIEIVCESKNNSSIINTVANEIKDNPFDRSQSVSIVNRADPINNIRTAALGNTPNLTNSTLLLEDATDDCTLVTNFTSDGVVDVIQVEVVVTDELVSNQNLKRILDKDSKPQYIGNNQNIVVPESKQSDYIFSLAKVLQNVSKPDNKSIRQEEQVCERSENATDRLDLVQVCDNSVPNAKDYVARFSSAERSVECGQDQPAFEETFVNDDVTESSDGHSSRFKGNVFNNITEKSIIQPCILKIVDEFNECTKEIKDITSDGKLQKTTIKVHNGNNKDHLCCVECSKVFKNKRQMKRHQNLHKYGRPFECKVCGRTFVENCVLKNHEKIHVEGKAYQCKLCPKKFDTIGHLKEHFLVHSRERSFQCEICGKIFGFKRTLQRHYVVHTDEKQYKCNICNKRFHFAVKVRGHQKRVHKNKIGEAFVVELSDNLNISSKVT